MDKNFKPLQISLNMIRKPAVSSQFYPSTKEVLEEEVKEYLGSKRGNIKAAIVPHAGYVFSGKLAGRVIGEFPKKKNFIILGVNHSGIGEKISLSKLDFETPLGVVKTNLALGEKIMKKLKSYGAEVNEQAHAFEHSIEVQLPFLQLSQKNIEIVPILLRKLDYEDCKKLARVLADFVDDSIAIIVSSDFTHYGKNYNFVPFNKDIKKNLYYLDNEIIINILNINSKRVYELADKSTVCGVYGITILTELAKIKNYKAKLVEYYTSGDVIDKWDSVVGYAGITFQ